MRGNETRLCGPAVIVRTTGYSVRVLASFAEQVIEDLREHGRRPVAGRTVRYADIPINLAVRCQYLEEGPRRVRESTQAQVWCCECALEAGVPEARCAPLSPPYGWSAIHRALVACANMVEDRRVWSARALGRWNAGRSCQEGS